MQEQLVPFQHCCVFVNQELHLLSKEVASTPSEVLPPCTHKVAKSEKSRLSISYELRHAAGSDISSTNLAHRLKQSAQPVM